MLSKGVSVESIRYNSREYHQACRLRYQLFYAEHNLAWSLVFPDSDRNCFHLAIVNSGNVLAYSQLAHQSRSIYQIKQMVVEPLYQKQNLGKQILLAAINLAKQQNATSLHLNSRLEAVGFYQKLGFQICGVEFPSSATRVIHLPMNKKL